ncbi:MAG: pyridoxamine 5'-phosphate oxidase [Bacteroidetes Order II. Incertae sedis bacterium]|jgi:pyridoxamine 5'-phosphate oxidase|nr:pyridoxamine 5'-phosphate oxidase [Bacteroidetes Order II. bacterium]MBT4052227.1 pyridoxamine 5'-phosphate oxidase [Bacteroidetes Order II. bacterium]MBT4603661.1 pyridoxamine 5'-phosphate oxidase [Bacteroidetes Order II. bacterium]MBT5249783.1 pyridoxamine 5'-phosphate oxidase [Bacteroidetes Order II. bacterium]MBT6201707.1 pyridoxamine 5'-phosphate oxidase [Bacteroidetes Order II. bacterium]
MSIFRSIKAVWTSGSGIAQGLTDASADKDPIDLFDDWFEDAKKSGLYLPEAMNLATSTAEGKPSARMVLLKHADQDGFVFYTNYKSRKSGELIGNPFAALLFHWPILQRQVRVEGAVEKVSREESEAYFHSRARGSQIGAWASDQSSELSTRSDLKKRVDDFERQFKDQEVPLPDKWGGFRVIPNRIEFWQGRPFRLHDRLIFEADAQSWKTHRLYP